MIQLNTIEAFAGTKSFSKVMEAHGHETLTIELDPALEADVTKDIRDVHLDEFRNLVDLFWASPPCQGFSVAVIGRNWNHDATPKTDSARLAMELVKHTMRVIDECEPRYWFIENPRGMLRKMPWLDAWVKSKGGVRHTVAYCQYGDTRQKPTDIWTNALWWNPKSVCKPGALCHEAAPRGSRTGTQGIKGAKDRGRIPSALFEEILAAMPR